MKRARPRHGNHTSTPSTRRLSCEWEASTSYKVKTKNVLGIAGTCTNQAPDIKNIQSNQLIIEQTQIPNTLSLGFSLTRCTYGFQFSFASEGVKSKTGGEA